MGLQCVWIGHFFTPSTFHSSLLFFPSHFLLFTFLSSLSPPPRHCSSHHAADLLNTFLPSLRHPPFLLSAPSLYTLSRLIQSDILYAKVEKSEKKCGMRCVFRHKHTFTVCMCLCARSHAPTDSCLVMWQRY